jgi:hypothetical protein
MPFILQVAQRGRSRGAGVGRVFPIASIANQPHTLENRYVPGAGVGASTIANRRALSRRAAYIRQPAVQTPSGLIYSKDTIVNSGFTVGAEVNKDMDNIVNIDDDNNNYTYEFDPNDYPQFFPNMAPFIDENILIGDKIEEDRLNASYWDDLGNDVFDDWGFFYLYDVNSGKYYFPLIDSQNNDDGIFATQIFYVFGRTFTVIHGWSVQGIFKFDISVADELPFRFGAYGNMGSDERTFAERLTHNYSIGGQNLTLYYDHNVDPDDDVEEQLYSYWIPKKVSENSARTYDIYYDGEKMSMMSKNVTTGLIVYFAKMNDVKDWVINDLAI